MEHILSVEEMREADRLAMEETQIPGLILMENAGLKTAQVISQYLGPIQRARVGIFCGKGNNGGDGFVIGRHLKRMGADVLFWLIGKREQVNGDARVNLEIAARSGLPIVEVDSESVNVDLGGFDILVDALLGTGLKGEVKGISAKIIEEINKFSGRVVAVDTPSGLDCDTGKPLGAAVQADLTVTMGNVKTGMLFYPGRELVGELFVADLSVPESIFEKLNSSKYLLNLDDYRHLLPERPADSYKNTFGKVLVIAGSTGLTGAACLCSEAILKSGAGMVILGCPENLNPIFEEKLTEVMTYPLPATRGGSLKPEAWDRLQEKLSWCNVVALGPGLSTAPETRELVQKILANTTLPMVIDADGLNNLAGATGLLKSYQGDLILTPHAGELARLTGLEIKEILANRIEIVRRFAREWQVILLLKGVPTIIGDPAGNIYFNCTGNSGMATAGSGDVLTGLIAGFLAQGLSGKNAALMGAFIHGMAGDRAAWILGQRGMVAGDMVNQISQTLEDLESNGFGEYFREPFFRIF